MSATKRASVFARPFLDLTRFRFTALLALKYVERVMVANPATAKWGHCRLAKSFRDLMATSFRVRLAKSFRQLPVALFRCPSLAVSSRLLPLWMNRLTSMMTLPHPTWSPRIALASNR